MRFMNRLVFAASVMALACGPKAPAPAAPDSASEVGAGSGSTSNAQSGDPSPPPCPSLIRGGELLVEPGALTLLGEMHGTEQSPRVLSQLACHAAVRNESAGVVVGLEIPSNNAESVRAYLDGEIDDEHLLKIPHFAEETLDGRNSQAMAAVISDVRRWRAAGLRVELVLYDAIKDEDQTGNERDAKMAENIEVAIRENPGATVLVLSGNLHNRTTPGSPWDAEFVPMGVHLSQDHAQIRSLGMRTTGGNMWVCMKTKAEEDETCGVHKHPGNHDGRGSEPFIEVLDERDEHGLDGFYFIGDITASPPAADRNASEG